MARRQKAKNEFGARIRRLRVEAGITVTDLANDADMSITYLSKVERGELPPPSEDKIRRLANALGISSSELLTSANRVPSDVLKIIRRHPSQYVALIRRTRHLRREQLEEMLDSLEAEWLSDEEDL